MIPSITSRQGSTHVIICRRDAHGAILYLQRGGAWTPDRTHAAVFRPDDYFEPSAHMCWMEPSDER